MWQDISTAPRDGTAILVFAETVTRDVKQCDENNTFIAYCQDDEHAGWMLIFDGMWDEPGDDLHPTHWMPLPSRPPLPIDSTSLREAWEKMHGTTLERMLPAAITVFWDPLRGDDANDGTYERPLKTERAANLMADPVHKPNVVHVDYPLPAG